VPDPQPPADQLILVMNTALVGVPAAYVVSGSVVVAALAAATTIVVTLVACRTRHRS
jgi:hypothetical protein